MDNIAVAFFENGSPFPASFQGDRWAYAFSVFGLFATALLAMEWLWRILWAFREEGMPFKHPLTLSRVVIALLLIGMLIRITPDVLLVMLWPEISPHTRAAIAFYDRVFDGLAIVPVTMAWYVGIMGAGLIEWQLARLPIREDMWPTRDKVKRSIQIGAGCLIIALTLAFVQR